MLVLSSLETAALVEPRLLLAEIRDALAAPLPAAPARAESELNPRDRVAVVFPLRAPGVPAYVIRARSEHFLQPPLVSYLLHDDGIGARLAHVDGAFLASVATGCVAALRLGEGARVGVLGASEAAATTIWMLRHLRALEEIVVHDPRPGRAESLAASLTAELELPVRAATREEARAMPLVIEEGALQSLDTSVAECVAVWHAYVRAREVSTTRPTSG